MSRDAKPGRPQRRDRQREARATSGRAGDATGPKPGAARDTEASVPESPEPSASRVSPAHAAAVHVIEPHPGTLRRYSADAWRHRTAYVYFVRRYLRKMYARTFFGYLWFVIPHIVPLLLGALVFGGIMGVEIPGVPYFLYFCVTFGVWITFSRTALYATRSLDITRQEIRRMYVPRLVPLAATLTLPVTTLLVYVALTAGTLLFYLWERGEFYLALSPMTLLVPVGLAMLMSFGLACGLWFSPLAPRARDVRRMVGYFLGFCYFLTPVMYPISEIPAGFQFLASLNPLTAPIEIVKQGLLGVGDVTSLGLVVYGVMLVLVTAGGLRVFVPKERRDMAFY